MWMWHVLCVWWRICCICDMYITVYMCIYNVCVCVAGPGFHPILCRMFASQSLWLNQCHAYPKLRSWWSEEIISTHIHWIDFRDTFHEPRRTSSDGKKTHGFRSIFFHWSHPLKHALEILWKTKSPYGSARKQEGDAQHEHRQCQPLKATRSRWGCDSPIAVYCNLM